MSNEMFKRKRVEPIVEIKGQVKPQPQPQPIVKAVPEAPKKKEKIPPPPPNPSKTKQPYFTTHAGILMTFSLKNGLIVTGIIELEEHGYVKFINPLVTSKEREFRTPFMYVDRVQISHWHPPLD